MPTNIAFPFQRIDQESIVAGPWQMAHGEEWVAVPPVIEHWDYDTPIALYREFSADLLQVLAEGRLREDAQLAVTVLSTTGKGAIRRLAYRKDVDRQTFPLSVEFAIAGRELQGDLQLDTHLVLMSAGRRPLALSASLVGSRLWSESFITLLEGQQGRLPMAIVDLQLVNPMYGLAPWYIDWSSANLEASFLGHVQLLLNSRRPEILERLDGGDSALISLAAADVARQILHSLISDQDSDFSGIPDSYPENSLGAVAGEWFQLCFSENSVEEIRALISVDPAAFDASVQSGFVLQQK